MRLLGYSENNDYEHGRVSVRSRNERDDAAVERSAVPNRQTEGSCLMADAIYIVELVAGVAAPHWLRARSLL
jgi:hypothetical protein